MGKRSEFERNPKDFYPTPYKAVLPLLPHLKEHTKFTEPCCGDLSLVRHLEKHGHKCHWASDVEPRPSERVISGVLTTYSAVAVDAMTLEDPLQRADCIITNPPYLKEWLFPMIEHFRQHNDTWLLLNADFMHNVGSAPYMRFCSTIVAVGRVKWIEGTKSGGKENFAWFRFRKEPCMTAFFGRTPKLGLVL